MRMRRITTQRAGTRPERPAIVDCGHRPRPATPSTSHRRAGLHRHLDRAGAALADPGCGRWAPVASRARIGRRSRRRELVRPAPRPCRRRVAAGARRRGRAGTARSRSPPWWPGPRTRARPSRQHLDRRAPGSPSAGGRAGSRRRTCCTRAPRDPARSGQASTSDGPARCPGAVVGSTGPQADGPGEVARRRRGGSARARPARPATACASAGVVAARPRGRGATTPGSPTARPA